MIPLPAHSPARQRAIDAVRELRVAQDGDVFDLIARLQQQADDAERENNTNATALATVRVEHRIAVTQHDKATVAGRRDMLCECLAWLDNHGYPLIAAAMADDLEGA